jgi:hypothetical protein
MSDGLESLRSLKRWIFEILYEKYTLKRVYKIHFGAKSLLLDVRLKDDYTSQGNCILELHLIVIGTNRQKLKCLSPLFQ